MINQEKISLEIVLSPLKDITGYLASSIVNIEGEILARDNHSELIDANMQTLIQAMSIFNQYELGDFQYIQINFANGILNAAWLIQNELVVIVLLETKGNAGLTKVSLMQASEMLK